MTIEGDASQESRGRELDRTLLDPAASSAPASEEGERGGSDSRPGDTLIVPPQPRKLPEIPGIQLLEEIGRGGMGVVYRGVQGYLDRTVAVKLLHGRYRGGDYEQRFQREARILAGLKHAHIVACYQAGVTTGGDCYLVMEFIDGPSLRRWLDQNGPVPIAQALRLCRDLAVALGHAHEANIIHRDVKPENVLLQRDEKAASTHPFPFHVKLADLGLARPTESAAPEMNLTRQATVMGTPATMAPEQFDDPLAVDYRSDIYGLGCVLFHAVTGQLAYPQATISATIASKMKGVGPDPRQFREGCPEGVCELITRLLAPRREDRPQSYAEVVAKCEALLATLERPAVRPARRRWSFVTAALAVAVSGSTWLWLSSRGEPLVPAPKPPGPEPEPPYVPPQPAPAIPLSVSWPDAVRENETVVLRVEPVDEGATFLWSIESSPELPAEKRPTAGNGPRIELTAPIHDSDYTLTFHVAQAGNGEARSAQKTVTVDVNAPPTAKIHDAERQVEAGETVEVQGSGDDPEDAVLTYRWRQLGDAPAFVLEGATSERLSFQAPEADVSYELRLELTVSDGEKDSEPCSTAISVSADPASKPLDERRIPLWAFDEGGHLDWEFGRGKAVFDRDDAGELAIECKDELVTRKRHLPRGGWSISGKAMKRAYSGKSGFLFRNEIDEDIALQLLEEGTDTVLRRCSGGESHVLGGCSPACTELARAPSGQSVPIEIVWTPDSTGAGVLSLSASHGREFLGRKGRPRELVLFARQIGVWRFSDFEISGR